MRLPLSPSLPFRQAAQQWLDARQFGQIKSKVRYCAPATLKFYANVLHALTLFFGSLPLEEIHLGNVESYRLERSEKAGPNKIIQEENVLIAILKRAGCWSAEMAEQYEPIQRVESDIPRALSPQEQAHWLEIAKSNPRWQIVYWYSMIAFRTTASNCEMRGIRLQDINLYQQVVTIQSPHAKNKFRIRTVPLPPDALWAMERLIERARSCGSTLPHQFLFPIATSKYSWNPERCCTEWAIRRPYWEEVQGAANLPDFTLHHLRHTAITRMAEAGVPMPVILSLAGHISMRMQQHYTSISDQAKRKAIMAVYGGTMYEDLRERRPVQNVQKPSKLQKQLA
jgi:integrase